VITVRFSLFAIIPAMFDALDEDDLDAVTDMIRKLPEDEQTQLRDTLTEITDRIDIVWAEANDAERKPNP
jgi:hypothetical protein